MLEVRRLRLAKGWNQNELAFHANLAPSVISEIETGKRDPSARTLRKLATALQVQVGDLFPKGQASLPFNDVPAGRTGSTNPSVEEIGRWLEDLDLANRRLLLCGIFGEWTDDAAADALAMDFTMEFLRDLGINTPYEREAVERELRRLLTALDPEAAKQLVVGADRHKEAIREAERFYRRRLFEGVAVGDLTPDEADMQLEEFVEVA